MKSLPIFWLSAICVVVVAYGLSKQLFGEQPGSTKPTAAEAGKASAAQTTAADAIERVTEAPLKQSPEARALWEQARQRLRSYQSIKAKLVETVALGQRRFTVSGAYQQGYGADLKLRLEFQVRVGNTDGSILEVCDGQVLWTRQQIGTETRISRRDVRQILQAAAESGMSEDLIIVELGFGGLPGLFASIEKSMLFVKQSEETYDGRKLVVIEGGWKPELLKAWRGNNPDSPLPDYVPSRVRLYFDANTLFPRRILYLGRTPEQSLRPIVSLDFTEVQTNIPLAADLFKFKQPEGVFPEDLTDDFLKQIKRRQLGGPASGRATP
jgi:hypothetical protein